MNTPSYRFFPPEYIDSLLSRDDFWNEHFVYIRGHVVRSKTDEGTSIFRLLENLDNNWKVPKYRHTLDHIIQEYKNQTYNNDFEAVEEAFANRLDIYQQFDLVLSRISDTRNYVNDITRTDEGHRKILESQLTNLLFTYKDYLNGYKCTIKRVKRVK